MKTMDLNFRMVSLITTILVLSGVMITGLKSPNRQAPENFSAYRQLAATVVNQTPQTSKPQIASSKPAQTGLTVVSTEVKDFTPEFDEPWCKANCPAYKGQLITLKSEDIVIVDEKGSRITDYQELVLKSSPLTNEHKTTSATHRFTNGFIHIKGIGPMKVNAIAFNYE